LTSGLFEESLDAVSVLADWDEVLGIVASKSMKRVACKTLHELHMLAPVDI
jgi:hypothetical protein